MDDSTQTDPVSDIRGRRFEIMASNFDDVFWMFNGDFTELLYVNDRIEDVYGLTAEEIANNPKCFLEEVHPDYRDHVMEKLRKLSEGERVRLEYPVNSASNYSRWVDVHGIPITDDDGTVKQIIGASREITKQKNVQEELQREKDRLRSIVYLQEAIDKANLDLDEIMKTVVKKLMDLTRADGAAIELVEDGTLVTKSASGCLADSQGLRLDIEQSLSGLCYRDGQYKRSDDVTRDDRINPEFLKKIDLETGSILLIPLEHTDERFGVLKIISGEQDTFDSLEENVINLLSGMLSAAIFQSLQQLEKEKYIEQVRTMALTDSLTGLDNRRSLMNQLKDEVKRANRHSRSFSFAILDLDHFKRINDSYGHQKGDEVLSRVARVLKDTTREIDSVSRYGGEEFGFLLPETKLNDAENLTERLLSEIRSLEFESDGESFGITSSAGVSAYREGEALEDLIKKADKALYTAKANGRDRVVLEK